MPGDDGGTGGPGGLGGAVHNTVGGDLTVRNSTFSGNSSGDGGTGGQGGNGVGMIPLSGTGGPGGAGQDGGAIANAGDLVITNSTFFDNRAGMGGTGGAKGAGVGNGGAGGVGGDGGAIQQAGAGSTTLINVTIAANTAGQGGGGGAQTVGFGPGGADGAGGGTFVTVFGLMDANNTIWSENEADVGANCGSAGTMTGTSNLDFAAGGACPGVVTIGNPLLESLADNGGPTKTMALGPPMDGPPSAAINRVPVGAPNCPGTDQRGIPRPQSGLCDIGAFEVVCTVPSALAGCPQLPVAPITAPGGSTTAAPGAARKKCKKGRKLKKGKCRKKKRKK